MLLPVSVNIEIVDGYDNANIVAAVIDFHTSAIRRMVRCVDGCTSILTADGTYLKILIPFEVAYKIYDQQHRIDRTFQSEVDRYYKENYKALKDKRNGKSD